MSAETHRSRQVVHDGAGNVTLETVWLPPVGPDEVVVRMETIGLCSSDIYIWDGTKRSEPGVIGHEGAGTVLSVGSEVGDWSPGDFAVITPLLACGACEACRTGSPHTCPDRTIVGSDGRGLTADVVLLDARALWRPPPGFAPDKGALVEPLACVMHAQDKLGAAPESTIVIVGAGPMGGLHALHARRRGVERIILVDRDPHKLDLARALPVDELVLTGSAHAARLGSAGDVVVIANSTRSGHELAFRLCRDGGRVIAYASIYDEPGPVEVRGQSVDVGHIHKHELVVEVATGTGTVTIIGAIGFHPSVFARSAGQLATLPGIDQLVTTTVGLSDLPAFVRADWKRELKVLIDPAG